MNFFVQITYLIGINFKVKIKDCNMLFVGDVVRTNGCPFNIC